MKRSRRDNEVRLKFALAAAGAALLLTFRGPAAEPVFMPYTNVPAEAIDPVQGSARDAFNLGTRQLRDGKLRQAEASLQAALAKQEEKIQPPALYNLGEVRFAQGVEELKQAPEGKPLARQGQAMALSAEFATMEAARALAGNDVQTMLSAYLNGRGTRRELKAATKAIRRALDQYGSALGRWQRSLDDFKSAAELNPADTNARHNADLVERAIAKLIDSIKEMQQAAAQMAAADQGLRQKLKELGGKIPESLMPPGAKGDEGDEDEGENGQEPPPEPQPGQAERESKDGKEMHLSPEEAGWLLDGFKLDGDRRLPMGQGAPAQPKDRKGRNW